MKGLTYTGIDDPTLPDGAVARWTRIARRRRVTVEEVGMPIIEAHNARWAIVGACPESNCEYPLVAGEFEAHYINTHVPARARHIVRGLLNPELAVGVVDEAMAGIDRLLDERAGVAQQ